MADGSKHGGIKGAEDSSTEVAVAGATLVAGVAALVVSGIASSNQKKKEAQQRQNRINALQAEISRKKMQIDQYSSKALGLGTHWYSSEISQLKEEIAELQAEINKLSR